MTGSIPGLPCVILYHPVLSVEADERFMHDYKLAANGELDALFVVIYEGSIPNKALAKSPGGYWSGMGIRDDENGDPQPVFTREWMERMSKHAAVVIAVGTWLNLFKINKRKFKRQCRTHF